LRGLAANVRSYYDCGVDLCEATLHSKLTYTCGFAQSPDQSLEELQHNKLDLICRKLRLQPSDELADRCCGFASLLIHAVENYDVSNLSAAYYIP
jgi:cyclopropane-fatty-acyl-phospholipid synthase